MVELSIDRMSFWNYVLYINRRLWSHLYSGYYQGPKRVSRWSLGHLRYNKIGKCWSVAPLPLPQTWQHLVYWLFSSILISKLFQRVRCLIINDSSDLRATSQIPLRRNLRILKIYLSILLSLSLLSPFLCVSKRESVRVWTWVIDSLCVCVCVCLCV